MRFGRETPAVSIAGEIRFFSFADEFRAAARECLAYLERSGYERLEDTDDGDYQWTAPNGDVVAGLLVTVVVDEGK